MLISEMIKKFVGIVFMSGDIIKELVGRAA